MEVLLVKLRKLAADFPNGFTVTIPEVQIVKSGWVVARKETQNSFGEQGLRKALEVALKTSKAMGGWKDGKLFYWDAVQIFEDETLATQAGIENEQMAIYQIETGRLKWLK